MVGHKIISQILEDGLCNGCGTCASLCPREAITITINRKKGIYIPNLDKGKCYDCETCFKVCPAREVDSKQSDFEMLRKGKLANVLIGSFLNCYSGYASDLSIRYNSASGGLITQLLIFARREEMIDGALVTRMKKEEPLEPDPFVARTEDEIVEASKSKYCPVPANISLKEILNAPRKEKFAVVGLPCHIKGIRRAEQISKGLREKIALRMGLFCGHSISFVGVDFFLNKIGVANKEIEKLDYRGKGWPGGMTIKLRNGTEKFVSLLDYWNNLFGHYFFTPKACFLCQDGTSELADISFGDAWLPEFSADRIGRSIVISRTEIGQRILSEASARKVIELSYINADKVIDSQRTMLVFKKKKIRARSQFLKGSPIKDISMDHFFSLIPLINKCLSENEIGQEFLKYAPLRLIGLYGKGTRYIESRLTRF